MPLGDDLLRGKALSQELAVVHAGVSYRNPDAAEWSGKEASCYTVHLADRGEVLLWARKVTVEGDGVLCLWGGNVQDHDPTLRLVAAFPAGAWRYAYASSWVDEHPMGIDRWRHTSPYEGVDDDGQAG